MLYNKVFSSQPLGSKMKTLKIVELKLAMEAADAIDVFSESADAASAAYMAEQNLAIDLEAKFYAEFNFDERDSGICNARQTFADNGMYAKFGVSVERSSEYWEIAIGSAQVSRDYK